ncbi:MAG: hypothetical protein WA632_11620 [Gallionella sp.]
MGHGYLTSMNADSPGTPNGDNIIEQRHTRGEIISRAEELLKKQLVQDLADYADLEKVGIRGKVGETTMYGDVDQSGSRSNQHKIHLPVLLQLDTQRGI